MASTVTFTPQELSVAARQFRSQLVLLPILGIQDTLKHMTARPGITSSEIVGTLGGVAQLAPHSVSRKHDFDLKIDNRELRVYLGSVVERFDPTAAVGTVYSKLLSLGDGLKRQPTALDVLAVIGKSISENLNGAIFNGSRNASGTTTKDLFNGFDTITQAEITANNIAAAKGNYIKLQSQITSTNAVDVLKSVIRNMHPVMRQMKLKMFCSHDIYDKYVDAYLYTHGAAPYNKGFEQLYVEGSNDLVELVPLANKDGSKFIQISPKENMLVGFDTMSNAETVAVEKHDEWLLSYIAAMFFGVQFESINAKRLMIAELADSDINTNEGGGSNETINTQDNDPKATLSLNVANANMGMVQIGTDLPGTSAAKQVTVNSSVAIKAIPNTGHVFVKWSDNNTNAERTISISENTTLVATFEEESEE